MSTLCCAKRECLPTVAVLSSVAAAAKEDAAKAGQGNETESFRGSHSLDNYSPDHPFPLNRHDFGFLEILAKIYANDLTLTTSVVNPINPVKPN
jgi:hypothetical protein